MATKVNFYLDNNLINPPKNWQELEIQLNFDKDADASSSQVSVNDWELVRENAGKIQDWINGGLSNGVGIFEGVPFKLEIERNGIIEKPFDGYLDLTERPKLSCNRSEVKAKERMKIDWLNDVSDGFTFEFLFRETGAITKNDFVFVPYVINSIPNYQESAIMMVSVFVLQQEIIQAIEKIKALAIKLSNPFESATAVVEAILLIVYIGLLLIAIIKLIKDLILMLIQPVKYHAGMRTRDLLRIGAQHLGLTFKSDIFDVNGAFYNEVIIPKKYNNPVSTEENKILGFITPDKNLQEGFYKGTFGDLLRAQKSKHNAKVIITDDGELYFVRQDFNISAAQFQLPDAEQPYYTTNADELKSNYLVEFQVDLIDKNTIQEYTGTIFQVITQPIAVRNQELVLMKGLESVNIPFALAKRKTELTLPEKIVKGFLDVFSILTNGIIIAINALITVFNVIIKVLNKIIKALKVVGINVNWQIKPIPKLIKIDFAATIENRIGMMKIETDFFNIDKVLLLTDGSQPKFNKLAPDNEATMSAKYLYNNFHFVNSFIPSGAMPNGNQVIIKDFEKIPFCFNDYQKVKNNNKILDANGNQAEIVSLNWNVYNQHADMTVRFSQLYTLNLREVTIEPNGK